MWRVGGSENTLSAFYFVNQKLFMLIKRTIVLFTALLIALSMMLFLPNLYAEAKVISPSQINLFFPEELTTLKTKTFCEIAETIRKRLDIRRDEIGRSAIQTVHHLAVYKETEPIFFAGSESGGYVFRVIVHWERNLGIVERQHTTIIDWEILNNQHYRAIVKFDDSTFPTHNLEELDALFHNLINT
ncbi:hypothetical protein BZZ01_11410 [Nostocales cyanobacterium HT-58-2]|nr:hypothetical protein BZZ01_11410 [Nostocales cyanobacterium HT-58-2]